MNHNQIHIGILGGGQLGRMGLPAANYFDVELSVLDPNPNAPCAGLVQNFRVGDFNDYDTVLQFGKMVDLLTIEIEHVNVAALYELEAAGKTVYPQPRIIEIIQDKRKQKQFYQDHHIPTSPFVLTETKADLQNHLDFLPAFQKLGKGGYDGAGVQQIRNAEEIQNGFDAPSILEKAVAYEKEISIIAARNANGEIELFPPVEMVFHPEHNLVDYLFAPAELTAETIAQAEQIVRDLIIALNFVGLLAVEMFVTRTGDVLVNEAAPRTHNSGHHTIQACNVSQFEQHLRAIMNLPLAKIKLHQPAAMVNLLGHIGETGNAKVYGLDDALRIQGVHVVLYGKQMTKPHRKMGHATVLGKNKVDIKNKIDQVRNCIKIGI